MPIVDVIEDTRRASSGSAKDGGRRAERWFTVLFSTAAEAKPVAARLAEGVPRIGAPHPEDVYLWVWDSDAKPMNGNPMLYEVNVKYRSAQTTGDNGNPLGEPPTVEYVWEESQEPIDRDATGAAIVTFNLEPYDPPLTRPIADLKLVIERNFESFDPFAAQTWAYVVNSDAFAGFPAGTALLKPISARQITDNPQFIFWRAHAEILFRVDQDGIFSRSWHRRILHRGYYIRDGVGLPPHWKLDPEGNLSPTPALLKADGREETNKANAVWNYVPIYQTMAFANLGLLT